MYLEYNIHYRYINGRIHISAYLLGLFGFKNTELFYQESIIECTMSRLMRLTFALLQDG